MSWVAKSKDKFYIISEKFFHSEVVNQRDVANKGNFCLFNETKTKIF